MFSRGQRREASGVPVFGSGSRQQNAKSVNRTCRASQIIRKQAMRAAGETNQIVVRPMEQA